MLVTAKMHYTAYRNPNHGYEIKKFINYVDLRKVNAIFLQTVRVFTNLNNFKAKRINLTLTFYIS